MDRGDLDYDDDSSFIGKVRKYSRSEMDEGDDNLPWEKEAWKANKLKYT